MAGVATLSDQVPLLDENRVLSYYGLKVLQKGRRPGLVELFKKAGVDITKLNEEDVTFTLAPRINAASRMADPMKAFELLSTVDLVEARTLGDHLAKINDDRKIMVAHIMKDVKSVLHKREDKPLIVIGNPSWRIGILGIIASKITEEYKKPAFVWGGDGNGDIKGSCRGYGGINLVEIMTSLPEKSLIEFGGHKNAGGFSVSHEEIHFLEERLLKVFEGKEMSDEETKDYVIDANVSIDDVTNNNYGVIKKLAPFGAGNQKPTFLFKGLKIFAIKEFGKEKNHLELAFKNSRGGQVKAISFFKTRNSFNPILEEGNSINLVGTFENNNFAGRDELRLRIVDIL
jgi:single-stranded-DNA-specific exonuclease